jgi:hypothetical protein
MPKSLQLQDIMAAIPNNVPSTCYYWRHIELAQFYLYVEKSVITVLASTGLYIIT